MEPSPSATRHRGDPISYVTNPTSNDVLLGRGAPYITFEGNRRFRSYVKTRKAEYVAARRFQTKEAIARSVINEIQRRGGRFLERVKDRKVQAALGVNDKDVWTLAPDDAVIEKCKQALRDKDPPGKKAARQSVCREKRMQLEDVGPPLATLSGGAFDSSTQQPRNEPPTPAHSCSSVQPSDAFSASVAPSSSIHLSPAPTSSTPPSIIPNLQQLLYSSSLPQPAPPWPLFGGVHPGNLLGPALQLQQQQQQILHASSQLAAGDMMSSLLSPLQASIASNLDIQQTMLLQSQLIHLQQFQPVMQSVTPPPHLLSMLLSISLRHLSSQQSDPRPDDCAPTNDDDSITSSEDVA